MMEMEERVAGMRVLVVEDEERLAEALMQIMTQQHYSVDVVHDGQDAVDYALAGQYDVIVLDVMLPKKDEFQVVTDLRAQKNATPILLLTARDEISDKVTGLDRGADDYMTKPFSPEELLARVRALARRQGEVEIEEVSFSDLKLNLSANTLHCALKSVHLGYKEFEIMRILMANSKALVSKDELIWKVWGNDGDVEDNSVEAYISFQRKKIFFLGSMVTIDTVRKVGYRLEAGG